MKNRSWWFFGASALTVTAILNHNWWWLLPAGIMAAAGLAILQPVKLPKLQKPRYKTTPDGKVYPEDDQR